MKCDSLKTRYDLIDWRSIEEMALVMTKGAETHGDQEWKCLPNGKDRYFSALIRHLLAWRAGEDIDKDSRLPHVAHVMCNAMFLLALSRARPELEAMDKKMSTPPPPPMASIPDFHFSEGQGHD